MVENTNKVNEVVEVSLGLLDVLSLFSGIASLVMGGLAIWLSITFYKMSDTSSKEIKSSSDKIDNNVQKLEKMFDTMYSDTFGMVKDTVSHMRQQVDRSSTGVDVSKELESRINKAISESLQEVPSDNLSKDEVKDLVLSLLKESKKIEKDVKKNALEEEIIKVLSEKDDYTYQELREVIIDVNENSVSDKEFFDTLYKLALEGSIVNNFREKKNGEKSILTTSKISLLE